MSNFKFEHIASLVAEGYTRGNYPDWKIEYTDIFVGDISEYSLAHVANCVRQGFIQGEIQEDAKSGWWKLSVS